jgi:L-arabinonolactonase
VHLMAFNLACHKPGRLDLVPRRRFLLKPMLLNTTIVKTFWSKWLSDKDFARTVDGATVDSEGYIWNAKVFGGRIVRYGPDGSVDRVIEVPVRNVTSVMFGGKDLDILYFTSMGRPMRGIAPTQTGAGGLFAISGLGVKGLPETRFAG